MNPRVSRSSALASKATGYPIAKVAAAARRRLHARRDPERPHGHDAGELRADARLRRRQVPALRVREVPRRRPDARHADEVGRRGDGHRPHVRRGVRQGVPLARARPPAPSDAVAATLDGRCPRTCIPCASSAELDRASATGARVGSATSSRSSTADCAAAQARRPLRRATSRARPRHDRGARCAQRRARLRRASRRTAASTRAPARSRPASNYFYSTCGEQRRGAADRRAPARRDPRLRPEPDRAGDRVRLLLRPRRAEFRALGYEAVMVNCNPETVSTDYDTSDRLYFEPLDERGVLAVFEREQPAGVVHPVRRPDAAQARARDRATPASGSSARRSTRSTSPRTASASAACSRELGPALPGVGDRGDAERGGRDRRAHRLPGARAALLRARRPRDARLLRRRRRALRCRRSSADRSSTASSRTRSRSTSTRSATARTRTSPR